MREITEGLRPIREGIENLPQAIKFPPIQLLGEASGKALEKAPEKEEPYDLIEIADKYLNETIPYARDRTFGIRKIEGLYYIGNNQATIFNNNILIDDEKFRGTPGLWELIMKRRPYNYTKEDHDNYPRLMIKTNALHQDYDPNNPHPRSSKGTKWDEILGGIWKRKKYMRERGSLLFRATLTRW